MPPKPCLVYGLPAQAPAEGELKLHCKVNESNKGPREVPHFCQSNSQDEPERLRSFLPS